MLGAGSPIAERRQLVEYSVVELRGDRRQPGLNHVEIDAEAVLVERLAFEHGLDDVPVPVHAARVTRMSWELKSDVVFGPYRAAISH